MFTIAAFYYFKPLDDLAELRATCRVKFQALELCGTLLIAPEGINGTLAGAAESISELITFLHSRMDLPSHNIKYSYAEDKPFKRLKVRLKREIITFGHPLTSASGTYVTPQKWNTLLDDPETVTLDTRNRYETEIGTFAGARDPKIDSFSQFVDYVRNHLNPLRDKKIAMFCTGGIRCEKASAYMRSQGFAEVYHLQGGILKYLEEIPAEQSKWKGACFVFDDRIALDHELAPNAHIKSFS